MKFISLAALVGTASADACVNITVQVYDNTECTGEVNTTATTSAMKGYTDDMVEGCRKMDFPGIEKASMKFSCNATHFSWTDWENSDTCEGTEEKTTAFKWGSCQDWQPTTTG